MLDIFGDEITIEKLQEKITFLDSSKKYCLQHIAFLETELKSLAKFIYLQKYQMFDDELFNLTTENALDIIKREIY